MYIGLVTLYSIKSNDLIYELIPAFLPFERSKRFFLCGKRGILQQHLSYFLTVEERQGNARLDTISCNVPQREQASDFACCEDLYIRMDKRQWKGHKVKQTWKKSKLRPMFWNSDGSSELSATGTPWLIKVGRGCIGIDAVSLYSTIA